MSGWRYSIWWQQISRKAERVRWRRCFLPPPPPTHQIHKNNILFLLEAETLKNVLSTYFEDLFFQPWMSGCAAESRLEKKKADLIGQEQCRMHLKGQIQLKANAHDNTRTWWSRCSVSVCSQGVFSFASICICFEKITESLTALNIPNSWHATETTNDETMFQQDEKSLHFFPPFLWRSYLFDY